MGPTMEEVKVLGLVGIRVLYCVVVDSWIWLVTIRRWSTDALQHYIRRL